MVCLLLTPLSLLRYYRQAEAVRHDVLTLRDNALRAYGEDDDVTQAARDAADSLLALLPPPTPLPALRLDGPSLPELLPGPRAPVTRASRRGAAGASDAAAGAAERGTRAAVAAAAAAAEAAAAHAAADGSRFSVRLRVRP